MVAPDSESFQVVVALHIGNFRFLSQLQHFSPERILPVMVKFILLVFSAAISISMHACKIIIMLLPGMGDPERIQSFYLILKNLTELEPTGSLFDHALTWSNQGIR